MNLMSGHTRNRLRTVALPCLVLLALMAAALLGIRYGKGAPGTNSLPTATSFSHGDAWLALGGEWTASSAEVQNNSEERGAKLMTRQGTWSDYQVQADLKMDSPYGVAGLILRSSGEEEGVDAYHGYFAGLRPMDSTIEFGRADFGWLPLIETRIPHSVGAPEWIHLRVVAVGCRFGVTARFPDGGTVSSAVEDPGCIPSGRFGLRSYLTSATWRNIQVSRATLADLNGFPAAQPLSTAGDLFLTSRLDPERLQRYTDSIRDEARKHQIQPGVGSIGEFPFSPGQHPNVTIRGIVISLPPLAAIQDETGAMLIGGIDPKISLKLGDYLEARGTVVSDHFRSRMEESHVRVLWSDTPVPPLLVTASQLTSGTYRGRSIELEGTLVSATSNADGYELVLQDGNQYFRATGSRDFRLDPADLKAGSRVRLKGIATSLSELTNNLYPFAVVTERIDIVSPPPWWSPRHVIMLALICVGLFICTQLILHKLQKWHLRSVLREREELAFQMHDTLAQSFTGIAYQLQAASTEKRGLEKVQTHIQNALQMVQVSHKEASRTIAALRPQYRDAADLLTALKSAGERLSDGEVRIVTSLVGRSTQLPLEITDALFRIGQEAISNAIQHSGCSEVSILLKLSKREVELTVADDGRGFSPESAGLGITGMRSRAAKTKARFDLATAPGAGTKITVTASLPLGHGLFYKLRAMLRHSFASATSG